MTESQPAGPMPTQFNINIPAELEGGVFANFAAIWQDQDSIVIDFAAAAGPAQPVQQQDGGTVAHVKAKVVSRVRIPPRQAIELMRGLGSQLDLWEQNHGPATPPSPES